MAINTLEDGDGKPKIGSDFGNARDKPADATVEFSRAKEPEKADTVQTNFPICDEKSTSPGSQNSGEAATLLPEGSEVIDLPTGLGLSGSDDDVMPTLDIPMFAGAKGISPDLSKTKHSVSRPKPDAKRAIDNSAVGTTIGNYQVLSVLGRGGMGVVYKARHTKLNRIVALKMILGGLHGGATVLQRFIAEAQSVAAMQHPGIVQIFEIAEHDGLPYFSLEFVDGQDLQSTLRGTPWSAKPAAELMASLCDAMQYAHDHQVMHRDIKPANILLDEEKRPKLSDFGLAKKLDANDQLTRDGSVVGTPSYMAPEQARGDVAAISTRSDIYSLGAVLYQLLTGRAPFVSDSVMDTLTQVIQREPVQPRELQPGVPVDLETICVKALQKDPSARYPSCSELAADLRRFINGEPILARPISRAERLWRWCKRNPTIAIPSSLAALFIISTAGVTTWAWQATSAQASIIADERDIAQDERDEAKRQKGIAEEQRAIALANEEKAKKEEDKAKKEQAEAERQRILANEAKSQAEKNQQLAEQQAMLALKNIQLVVTEVDDRLAKEPGMSPIRVGMLEVLEKQWDALDVALAGGIQGEAIPTLMAVRSKIADAWSSVDRIKEANAQYEVIYTQAKERLLVKNRSDASRFNLALICVRWAPVRQRLAGDPAVAEKLLNESNELLREILADPRSEPNSPKLFQIADALQQSLMRVASMHLKKGALDKARDSYQEIEKICSKVLDEVAQSAEWYSEMPEERKTLVKSYFQQNRDLSLAGQANILCRLGKSEDAILIYDRVIEWRNENVEQNPMDRNARDQLALQLRNYGQNMMRLGRAEEAVRLMGRAQDWTEKNLSEDPTNAAFKRSHGHSLYYWGVARDAMGQTPDAVVLFERSRALRQEMVQTSPDQSNKVNLMLSEARLGNRDAAKILIEDLAKSEVKDPDLRLDIARALAQLSRSTEGDLRSQQRSQAIESLERSVADGLTDPFAVSSEWDLVPLRGDDRFRGIIEKLKGIQSKSLASH